MLFLLGSTPGPMITVTKSSILQHNKAHCWHPGLKGSLENPLTQAPDWAQISPLWQGRFLAEQASFERTKLPWHCKGLLDHCHSVVHTTYYPTTWYNPPQVDTPARAIRTFLDQLAVAQDVYNTMAKLFCISVSIETLQLFLLKTFLTLFHFFLLHRAWIT